MRARFKAAIHAGLGLIPLAYACWTMQGRGWTVSRAAGLAVAMPAFVLWLIALLQLGRSFTIRACARQLVTKGLYSKIRNPIYIFSTLYVAGLLLLLGGPLYVLFVLPLIALQLIRARREAEMLEAAFGDAYRQYRRGTWL